MVGRWGGRLERGWLIGRRGGEEGGYCGVIVGYYLTVWGIEIGGVEG